MYLNLVLDRRIINLYFDNLNDVLPFLQLILLVNETVAGYIKTLSHGCFLND